MKGAVEILTSILERFKLWEPVPVNIREYSLKTKSREAKSILHHYGEYSIGYGAAMAVFYFVRQLGLRLSMRQAKALLAGTVILVSSIVITIIVITIYYPYTQERAKIIDNDERNGVKGLILPNRGTIGPSREKKDPGLLPDKTARLHKAQYRLGVEFFTSEAVSTVEARANV